MSCMCPYCNNNMKEGFISGDGRSRVRWEDANEKVGRFEKAITNKGCIAAKYTLTSFHIKANYCENCGKIIFDARIIE